MDLKNYSIYDTKDDRKILCEKCNNECIFVCFPEVPEYVLDTARKRGLYVCTTEEGKHVIAVCENCVDKIAGDEK